MLTERQVLSKLKFHARLAEEWMAGCRNRMETDCYSSEVQYIVAIQKLGEEWKEFESYFEGLETRFSEERNESGEASKRLKVYLRVEKDYTVLLENLCVARLALIEETPAQRVEAIRISREKIIKAIEKDIQQVQADYKSLGPGPPSDYCNLCSHAHRLRDLEAMSGVIRWLWSRTERMTKKTCRWLGDAHLPRQANCGAIGAAQAEQRSLNENLDEVFLPLEASIRERHVSCRKLLEEKNEM